jgi:predicted pyridoxine 5'-phosphate oxidase superfamily flavin-nucleotide-binding protein
MTGFHAGEIHVQRRLGVREDAERVGRIVASEIPSAARAFMKSQRMAVVASLDARGRPWASLLTGPAGFLEADAHRLEIAARPIPGDPLSGNLRQRPALGLLVFDPLTRRRLRVNGRGLLSRAGLVVLADEVYGNCPRYIRQRRLVGESRGPTSAAQRASSLDEPSRAIVGSADTLFIATWHPEGGADASHRGGGAGFVHVRDERTLELPDYPGNNMFNTLGNLMGHPRAGLLFVDFEGGDLVQITGTAQVLWGPETTVRVVIEEVLKIPAGCPLRYERVEPGAVSEAQEEAR